MPFLPLVFVSDGFLFCSVHTVIYIPDIFARQTGIKAAAFFCLTKGA